MKQGYPIVRDEGVAGSNPATPTISHQTLSGRDGDAEKARTTACPTVTPYLGNLRRRTFEERAADPDYPMGVVYFITDGAAIKIGVTGLTAKSRMKVLQQGHYNRLRLLAWVRGDEEYERRLHHRFRHLRIRGEWFRDEPELRDFIASLTVRRRMTDKWAVIDKHGHFHGPFLDSKSPGEFARRQWPDEQQDERRVGLGWDIEVIWEPVPWWESESA